jgi:hypothetical protein
MIFFRAFVPGLMSGLQLYKPTTKGFIPTASEDLVSSSQGRYEQGKLQTPPVLRFDDELTLHSTVAETAAVATME